MRKLFLALAAICTMQLAAQHRISGQLINESNYGPVEDAFLAVFTRDSLLTTGLSDQRGYFMIEVPGGTDLSLSISHVSFENRMITLHSDSMLDLRIVLVPIVNVSDEVVVNSTRVGKDRPGTQSTINKKEIERSNLGQDMPFLLNLIPGAVVNSDAGTGIGYTGIRIRGVDPTRINVTINGIPVNDAESQGMFWVNMPDFASSVQSIQVQRGAGTSTNGSGAFGATINLQTNAVQKDPYAMLNLGIGVLRNNWSKPNLNGWNLNSQKASTSFGTGLMNNNWYFEGRLSSIRSDGFIDRSSADLKSWYFSGAHYGKKSVFKLNYFGGQEVTYQAWNGIPEPKVKGNLAALSPYYLIDDSAALARSGNRTYNAYTYDREVDDYQQQHLHIHYSRQLTSRLTASVSIHQTLGKGFYEQYRKEEDLVDYGLNEVITGQDTTRSTDLIRRRWLDNWFRGVVYSLNYSAKQLNLTWGGAWNIYQGAHFGEVIWARFASNGEIRHRYYDNYAIKADFTMYGKATHKIGKHLSLFADLQYRKVDYSFLGLTETGSPERQEVNYQFFNPKAGVQYQFNEEKQAFLTYSRATREPVRDDFVSSSNNSRPRPEKLDDIELGYEYAGPKYRIQLVAYAMMYIDQLILTGKINDVGAYTRVNVPKSSRMGIEAEYSYNLTKRIQWNATAALSRNKVAEFEEFVDNWDTWSQERTVYRNTDLAFSPALILSSMIRFKITEGIEMDWIIKYVSRQYLDNTQNTARMLDPFLVNDLRLSLIRKNLLHSREAGFNLLIANVLNTQYEPNGYTFSGIINGQRQDFNYLFPQAGVHFLLQGVVKF